MSAADFPSNGGNADEFLEALGALKSQGEQLEQAVVAESLYGWYQALTDEGFTSEQAMALLLTLIQMGGA